MRRARGARSIKFEDVAHVGVAEAFGDLVGPTFEFGGVDFHGGAAGATSEVVVVRVIHATSVQRLATIGHDHVDLVRVGEFAQLAVDRGQGHFGPVAEDEIVQILGAHEALHAFEGPDDFTALGGVSRDCHVFSVVAEDLFSVMILIKILRMILKKGPS